MIIIKLLEEIKIMLHAIFIMNSKMLYAIFWNIISLIIWDQI